MPQRGNNNTVELPNQLPRDDFLLKDLEPLGWIKTQALELNHLSPTDVTTQSKLMADHPEWGSNSICLTVAFTPGSVSLSSHQLSVAGFEWGRKNTDTSPNPTVSVLVLASWENLLLMMFLFIRASIPTCRSVYSYCCRTVFWA